MLARRQHWVVAHHQLLVLGFTPAAIRHRVATGRLHRIHRGIYAVGRRDVSAAGAWIGATLLCGARSFISHPSAAALWGVEEGYDGPIHVSMPSPLTANHPGIVIHRRTGLRSGDVVERRGIRVTSPALTIVDLASVAGLAQLERAINKADALDLIDPEALRAEANRMPRWPGRAAVCRLLHRRAFTLTDSELERLLLPIARRAGLPPPLTQQRINGFRVDFYWPDLGLVVETDGLRYHRTPSQQARDRERDQVHTAAGLTPLRFTHAQVRYEALRVEVTLRTVAGRLSSRSSCG